MDVKQALAEFRKQEKRKFDQSIDLVVNLKNFDLKRDQVNVVLNFPHKIKDKNVCAFLSAKSKIIDSVVPAEFKSYKDKKDLKKLVNKYDFFIAFAPLMPQIATNFGKILGPAGKMPTPQLGMIAQETDHAIKEIVDRISSSIKIRLKESSIKLVIGKESMKDEQIIENFNYVKNSILNALPRKNDNVKNILIKTTMSKPIRLEVK